METSVAAGLQLMLVGMGTVFVFLTVLVFAVQIMSALLLRLVPETSPARESEVSGQIPKAHVAAISAALERHRQG